MSRDCIYNTDPTWASVIQSNGIKNDVNFWRQGTSHEMRLESRSLFYFRDVSRRIIIGRAMFVGAFYNLNIDQAWERFGLRNGLRSLSDFHKAFSSIYDTVLNYNLNIGCIVLNNVEWLNEESYFPTNDSLFHPKINAFKYFKHGSFPELEARFLSTSDLSIPDVAGIVSVPLPPKVDMPLSTHDDEQWKTPPAIDIELPVGGPTRVMVHDYRILRDTAIAAKAKNIYNYRCQICPAILQAPSGARYAESHHIKPIGFPHNGPDILENVLCLCPNCHAQLDYGIIPIDVRRLNIHTSHQIHKDFILYHNQEIYGKVIWR